MTSEPYNLDLDSQGRVKIANDTLPTTDDHYSVDQNETKAVELARKTQFIVHIFDPNHEKGTTISENLVQLLFQFDLKFDVHCQ